MPTKLNDHGSNAIRTSTSLIFLESSCIISNTVISTRSLGDTKQIKEARSRIYDTKTGATRRERV